MANSRETYLSATTIQRFVRAADQARDRWLFLLVAGPLLVIYLLTATWSYPGYNDAFTNSVVGWGIGTHGSPYLEEHTDLVGTNWPGWIVPAGDSASGKYPPGAALLAAPVYAIWPEEAETITAPEQQFGEFWPEDRASAVFPLHPMGPAAITSAAATAIAMALLALGFRRIGGSGVAALVGGYVAGLGTAAWSVASDQLWQHGPAMMWIALALLLSEHRLVGSGLAFGMAILTRPPLAVIAATTGLYRSLRARALRPAILVGAGAAVGLVVLVAYNGWVYGSPSISGGYGSGFSDNARQFDTLAYARNLFYAGFSTQRGVFVFSPFLLILLPGLQAAWRAAPDWAKGAGIGAVAYLLLQYKANNYAGGFGFPTYRYPLEALTAAAPLLFLSYRQWVAERPRMVVLFGVMVGLAAILHLLGAIDPDLVWNTVDRP
ncbi:MAG: hypothetical protein OER12_06810 [Acidimicrobiia bacterium]|nr:hypothetical protein [Acidimicrobiia bacterium]